MSHNVWCQTPRGFFLHLVFYSILWKPYILFHCVLLNKRTIYWEFFPVITTVSEKPPQLQQDNYVQKMTNSNLKPNLEAILNDVNRFINIKSDRQLYATHFVNLRDQIFKKLREDDLFDYLFKGYQMGGK